MEQHRCAALRQPSPAAPAPSAPRSVRGEAHILHHHLVAARRSSKPTAALRQRPATACISCVAARLPHRRAPALPAPSTRHAVVHDDRLPSAGVPCPGPFSVMHHVPRHPIGAALFARRSARCPHIRLRKHRQRSTPSLPAACISGGTAAVRRRVLARLHCRRLAPRRACCSTVPGTPCAALRPRRHRLAGSSAMVRASAVCAGS